MSIGKLQAKDWNLNNELTDFFHQTSPLLIRPDNRWFNAHVTSEELTGEWNYVRNSSKCSVQNHIPSNTSHKSWPAGMIW